MDRKVDANLKCDSDVGKSSLMKVFTTGEMPTHAVTTTVAEYEAKVVKIRDGRFVKAGLWDTAGQERYRSLTSAYYRRAHGVIVVYDVTRRNSFKEVTSWISTIRNETNDAIILLIGNKMDMVSNASPAAVSQTEHDNLCQQEGISLSYRLTAKDTATVNSAFLALIEATMENHVAPSRRSIDGSVLSVAPADGGATVGLSRPAESGSSLGCGSTGNCM